MWEKIKLHDKQNGITKHKENEMKFIPYAVIYGKCQPKNILANT
jgi:hypothetical protein